jgi:hypothetical protein
MLKYLNIMVIKSLVNIQFNVDMITSINEKVIGEITRVEFSGDFQRLVVTYKYTSESDTLIKRGSMEFKGDEIDTLDSTVQQILPDDYDTYGERDKMMYKYLNGFKIKMAETFNIEVIDIEII